MTGQVQWSCVFQLNNDWYIYRPIPTVLMFKLTFESEKYNFISTFKLKTSFYEVFLSLVWYDFSFWKKWKFDILIKACVHHPLLKYTTIQMTDRQVYVSMTPLLRSWLNSKQKYDMVQMNRVARNGSMYHSLFLWLRVDHDRNSRQRDHTLTSN